MKNVVMVHHSFYLASFVTLCAFSTFILSLDGIWRKPKQNLIFIHGNPKQNSVFAQRKR